MKNTQCYNGQNSSNICMLHMQYADIVMKCVKYVQQKCKISQWQRYEQKVLHKKRCWDIVYIQSFTDTVIRFQYNTLHGSVELEIAIISRKCTACVNKCLLNIRLGAQPLEAAYAGQKFESNGITLG